ncbi:MAG: 2-oxoacid:ferredoxin oxidoreductase subunit gamma [Tenericutes bacterium HGW-Tenericutes-1]|jgi:2-oxoglutarate ferredoxin oxidoreductase subunit gamma|nr:MAG: 2-oxoacid:ferredoxin oxidoreductase subunit gamma [Tenericutes bacterium HGW-Tenericutes-1]
MNETYNIKVAGFGGQGVMMVGQILAYAATDLDLYALWYPSYGPETRGGTANCSVIVSKKQINSPVFQKATHLIAFNQPSLDKFINNVKSDGVILYNSSLIDAPKPFEDVKIYGVPANEMALELGNIQVANMIIMGAYLAITDMFTIEIVEHMLKKLLGERKAHLMDINKQAIQKGFDFIKNLGGIHA